MKINEKIVKIEEENAFLKVSSIIADYKKKHPNAKLLSLGIGDVSKPIVKPIIKAMHEAVDDLASMDTFKGYGASYGYDFLKEKILENDYKDFHFTYDEIYISNGTKTDSTNILELFDINSKICITNVMYPIYRDGAMCLNREVTCLPINEENSFIPEIPKEHFDIIYICSPSNPTGICYTYQDLEKWVKYAIDNQAVILYDNVYTAFISSSNVPKSIYEVKDAKKVAIEFRSFSKNAGFTGVRCSYYVIPKEIGKDINKLWKKRTINRFNGADYIAQKGATAVYLKESQQLIKENINYYHENARILRSSFENLGFQVYGGIDSPFMWVKILNNMTSWEWFNFLLNELEIIVVPGIIFGSSGNNYFRVSALGNRENIKLIIERLKKYYEKENL